LNSTKKIDRFRRRSSEKRKKYSKDFRDEGMARKKGIGSAVYVKALAHPPSRRNLGGVVKSETRTVGRDGRAQETCSLEKESLWHVGGNVRRKPVLRVEMEQSVHEKFSASRKGKISHEGDNREGGVRRLKPCPKEAVNCGAIQIEAELFGRKRKKGRLRAFRKRNVYHGTISKRSFQRVSVSSRRKGGCWVGTKSKKKTGKLIEEKKTTSARRGEQRDAEMV